MEKNKITKTTLGGGCFWCLEAVFQQVNGVDKVVSGYAGGQVESPSYEQVSSGKTGHAEVVQLTFNSNKVSFKKLLEIFFAIHDPTTLNRQGADIGSQYRSIILYHSLKQKKQALEMIRDLSSTGIFDKPIITQVEPLKKFYPAETYHQKYYLKNPNQPYCRLIIDPKLKKLLKNYPNHVKKQEK